MHIIVIFLQSILNNHFYYETTFRLINFNFQIIFIYFYIFIYLYYYGVRCGNNHRKLRENSNIVFYFPVSTSQLNIISYFNILVYYYYYNIGEHNWDFLLIMMSISHTNFIKSQKEMVKMMNQKIAASVQQLSLE